MHSEQHIGKLLMVSLRFAVVIVVKVTHAASSTAVTVAAGGIGKAFPFRVAFAGALIVHGFFSFIALAISHRPLSRLAPIINIPANIAMACQFMMFLPAG